MGEELTISSESCTINVSQQEPKIINIQAGLISKPDLARSYSVKVRVSSSHVRLLELTEN